MMGGRPWNDEDVERLKLLYPDHTRTIAQIARELGRTVHSVIHARDRLGIWRGRESRVDESSFSTETPETAYWAGFLMADGSVGSNNPSVSLTLSSKDEAHIERFRSFVKGTNPIRHPREGASTFSIHSPTMVSDLSRWGVVPRKTYVGRIPGDIPDHLLPHYLRGLFDGDGGIYIRNYTRGKYRGVLWVVSLTNNDAVVSAVQDTLSVIGITTNRFVAKKSPVSNHTTYSISVSEKTNVKKLLEWLSYEDGLSLPRKAEVAKTILGSSP